MTVRFLLGDKPVAVTPIDPTQTVLQWLRERGRVGTKEGCAEGDCGACTVVLGELDDCGRPAYRAVNACILFVPELAGKQLLTVEDLAEADGALHPVQRALVDHHASQCGFCTPGFVMSLFALFHQAGDSQIHDALAGNLCRCTGYRPIVDAARACLAGPRDDRFVRYAPDKAARLRALAPSHADAMEGAGTRYLMPRDLAELERLRLSHPDAVLLAGGTDVGLWITKEHRRLGIVISLNDVRELQTVEERPDRLDIGAGATYARLLPLFQRHWPSFGELLCRLGSAQIRNSGTMGGNIANGSPIGDSMPALIALRAVLVLNRGGTRRELPLEAFFVAYRKTALLPGEFVERIRVPLDPAWRFATYKVSKRYDQDISAVAVGIGVMLDRERVADIRLAYGGMAATPKRAAAAEAALRGQAWTLASVMNAAVSLGEDFQPIGDMRAGAEYRLRVARNLLVRFYRESVGDSVRLGQVADG